MTLQDAPATQRPDPYRSEATLRAWKTRRAKAFSKALTILLGPDPFTNLSQLQHAAHTVACTIAAHLPGGADALPRGYRVTKNGWGERAIAAPTGVILNPVYTSPAPDQRTLALFANDLQTGWLFEVLYKSGAVLDFAFAHTSGRA